MYDLRAQRVLASVFIRGLGAGGVPDLRVSNSWNTADGNSHEALLGTIRTHYNYFIVLLQWRLHS